MTDRKPSVGLHVLEALYEKYPNRSSIKNSLINAYIRLGYHDIALDIIASIPESKCDVQTLKFKAWVAHVNTKIEKENLLWDKILEKSFHMEFEGNLGNLFQKDYKKINIVYDDILLFCVERNELLRLPFFLQYYRKLGVAKFFFVDNNSNDGSLDFLLSQPDCYVSWSNNSYKEAGYGQVWSQYLIEKYVLENQWYLIVDADEFLVYPYSEYYDLNHLTNYLNLEECTALSSFILDMFPVSLSAQLEITAGDNLIEKSGYFYNNYEFQYQIGSPYKLVNGGIFGFFNHKKCLTVTPLFKKTTHKTKLLASRHLTTSTKISKLTSTLLHFKFLGDFQSHAIAETKRKEHWQGGVEYRIYNSMFTTTIDKQFTFADLVKTTQYQDSQQLIDLDIIKCPNSWLQFIKSEPNYE